jgi:3-hydroxyisobutyrate dehydrogenase-like beta-hydroxyacid dehydrogenase
VAVELKGSRRLALGEKHPGTPVRITTNTGDSMEKIGLIGVGLMGHGIATNIAKHGYPLLALEHPGNQPLDALVASGVKTTSNAAELARAVDIVILCVTGTPQVEDVLYRDGGVLEGIRSSTVRIANSVVEAGGRFLDAPMTRTPKEAAQGRLNLIVGGEPDLFEQCRPLLASFAENIVFAGPVSSGHRLKLLHNFVSLGYSAVLAEAAACAKRAGVDPAVLVEVLAKGGGAGVILERLKPFIEDEDSSGFRFSMANALKDLGYYVATTEELDAANATALAIRRTYALGVEQRGYQAPVPELISVLSSHTVQPD